MLARPVALSLALAACGPQDGSQPRPPPPGIGLTLEASALVRGETATFTVRGAPPGGRVHLAYSAEGRGPGPCLAGLGGLCLDLSSPMLLATLTADAAGEVTVQPTVPIDLAVDRVSLQAVVLGATAAKSSALDRDVRDLVPELPACHALAPSDAAPGASRLFLPVLRADPTARWDLARLTSRPLRVSAAPGQEATLTADPGLSLHLPDGTPLALPFTLDPASPPLDLILLGAQAGRHTLTLTPTDTASCAVLTLDVAVDRLPPLTGRSLAGHPGFQSVRTFDEHEPIEVALDPRQHPDRVGQTFDIHVVTPRAPRQVALDPTLPSLASVTATLAEGTVEDNVWTVWDDTPTPYELTAGYDLVVDFGRDGRFDPGDLLVTDPRGGFFVVRDLTAPGPRTTRSENWTGSGLFRSQRVFAPSTIAPDEVLDTVVISHGNGHFYTWYDYLGEHLASHGYVTMSHASNTGPGPLAASNTLADNLDQFYGREASWFGGDLAGHLSRQQAWVGHSRGGEAIAVLMHDYVAGTRAPTRFDPSDVRLLASIAPTVFYNARSNPGDVPYQVFAGGADGDVTGGADCPTCQSWRLSTYATGRVSTVYLQGVAHNDFLGPGFGFDDGVGPARIGRDATNRLAKAYVLALVGLYLEGRTELEDYLARGFDAFRPGGVDPTVRGATTWLPGPTDAPLVLDDFQQQPDPDRSSSGGAVTATVDTLGEGLLDDPDPRFTHLDPQLMNGMTQVSGDGDDRGLIVGWSRPSHVEWELVPGLQDVRDQDFLMARLTQVTRHPSTVALAAPLSVTFTLRDAEGRTASLDHGPATGVTSPYPRDGLGPGFGWANEFSTLRLRLSDFLLAEPDLDLGHLVAVRLEVGRSYGSEIGRIGLDDLLFSRELLAPVR